MIPLLLLFLCAQPPGASCTISVSGEIVAPVTINPTEQGFSVGKIIEDPAISVHQSITIEILDGKPYTVHALVLE